MNSACFLCSPGRGGDAPLYLELQSEPEVYEPVQALHEAVEAGDDRKGTARRRPAAREDLACWHVSMSHRHRGLQRGGRCGQRCRASRHMVGDVIARWVWPWRVV